MDLAAGFLLRSLIEAKAMFFLLGVASLAAALLFVSVREDYNWSASGKAWQRSCTPSTTAIAVLLAAAIDEKTP